MTFTIDTNNKSKTIQFYSKLLKLTTTGTFDGAQLLIEAYDAAKGRFILIPNGSITTAAVTDVLIQNPSNKLRVRAHNSAGDLESIAVTIEPQDNDLGGFDYAT